jgi:hypothetical protein
LSGIDAYLTAEFAILPAKPVDTAPATAKKGYSEAVSNAAARAFAQEFRDRGLKQTRPAPPGQFDSSGAERRMSGGIGAKKVDVTWATEESGLILGISIKSINFRDSRSGNFQKNLTNRRGDMLFEGVTLHRRFPYSVLGGVFFLDRAAYSDGTTRRKSTFLNTHARLRLFTGRDDPGGRDEQYEHLFIVLLDSEASPPSFETYAVGYPESPMPMSDAIARLVESVAVRNPDFYESTDGKLRPTSG